MRQPSDGAHVAGNAAAARDAYLRELANGALRRAARAARPADRVDPGVRMLIREVCDVAHQRGLRAEQLLLFLKDAWRELPEGLRLPRHDAGDVLASAITVCIDEYYAQGNGRR